MINFNDQDKGYKDGLQLAREGKKKHYFNFSKLKAFFSSHALDTYIDGVNQGYLDGLREKNLVHQTNPFIDDRQRQEIKQQFSHQNKSAPISTTGGPMTPIIERVIRHLEETATV